jgi:hypothetical protein
MQGPADQIKIINWFQTGADRRHDPFQGPVSNNPADGPGLFEDRRVIGPRALPRDAAGPSSLASRVTMSDAALAGAVR